MSRVLLLDLGETLIHDGSVLPHVPEALEALAAFTCGNGKPLQRALVSDTDMPQPSPTAAKIKPIFDDYLETLDEVNLRRFFEPVKKHITLSAHAGVFKPDRKVFALALKRLGVSATLADCIFVTENADHVRHCRKSLGMKALQFGKDFSDWSDAPLIVASMIGPSNVNVAAALKPWGAAHGLEGLSLVEAGLEQNVIHAQAQVLARLSGPGLGEAEGAYVQVPVHVDIRRDAQGRLTPSVGQPSAEDVKEATSYVRGLASRGEIGGDSGSLATHVLEVDNRGRRVLKRRGFKTALR
jgi:hypothetical protein